MSRQNRRTILKKSGAAIAGATAVTGTKAADGDPTTSSAEDTIHFTPDNAIEQPTTQNSPDTEELDHLDDWGVHMGTVECDNCDRILMEYNSQTTIYRSRKKDDSGNWHYVYWMWVQSDTNTGDGNDSSLKRLESRVDIKQYDEVVTNFEPTTTEKMNERSKDVGMSFGFTTPSGAGFSASVSDTIYVDDGEYGPWMNHVDLGNAGEFGVSIDANSTTGRQTLMGILRTRLNDDWTGIDDYFYSRYVANCHECGDSGWFPF